MKSIEQLQAALLKFNLKKTKAKMAPLLYELRMKMRAPGRKGKGFGLWCEENLTITRRTADLWADEWAKANNKPTFRKASKGLKVRAKKAPVYRLPLMSVRPAWFTEEKESELNHAINKIVGDQATLKLMYDVVMAEVARRKALNSEAMAVGA
jgi:hypothetical protein